MKEEKKLSWIDFFMKWADKIKTYSENRQELIDMMEKIYKKLGFNFPLMQNGEKLKNVCPFTIIACINRGVSDENRKKLASEVIEVFDLDTSIPEDFIGVPTVDARSTWFFTNKDGDSSEDIQNLWDLFWAAIEWADQEAGLSQSKESYHFNDLYDKVITQKKVKWNITMGLYWIRPNTYLSLDSCSKAYLLKGQYIKGTRKELDQFFKNVPNANTYLNWIKECLEAFKVNEVNTFPKLAYEAFMEKNALYTPELKVYDPGITKEKWRELLIDPEIKTHSGLKVLWLIYDMGGEATCKQLSEKYGDTSAHYNLSANHLARLVAKKAGCSFYINKEGKQKIWPVLFYGRNTEVDEEGDFVWKLRETLNEALSEIEFPENIFQRKRDELVMNKNTILYGPPGTGKTYHTVLYAVAIIEEKSIEEIKQEAYEEVYARYLRYKQEKKIEFTTFHQSYGYEEFIEGIKPIISETGEEGEIFYDVVPGLFKAFCEQAEVSDSLDTNQYGINEDPTIWKVSLWGTGDNEVRTECLENGHIRIGWDDYGKNINDETDFNEMGGRNVLNSFINSMQIGDIVLSCYTERVIDAIGVVTGDYYWNDSFKVLKRVRDVKWLVKGIKQDIYQMNNNTVMTLASVYRLKNIALADVLKIVDKKKEKQTEIKTGNKVFIIDEINRGNISKIFGELITLIEDTKRKGESEEMEVRLPYSKKPFGIPNNIYIFGTMNTADRSIAHIDTALRRRFHFIEMQPDAAVLEGIEVEGIDIAKMFSLMNKRITVLCDREHTLGHAYFLPLKGKPTIEILATIFKNNIIPLLQEYFYEDYNKIRLVLGDNHKNKEDQFVRATDVDFEVLFGEMDEEWEEEKEYEINEEAFLNLEAYKQI